MKSLQQQADELQAQMDVQVQMLLELLALVQERNKQKANTPTED